MSTLMTLGKSLADIARRSWKKVWAEDKDKEREKIEICVREIGVAAIVRTKLFALHCRIEAGQSLRTVHRKSGERIMNIRGMHDMKMSHWCQIEPLRNANTGVAPVRKALFRT